MNHFKTRQKKGFTLVEILLYMTLVSVMVVLLGNIGLNVLFAKAKGQALEEVAFSSYFASTKVINLIQEAESVNNTAGATSSILSLASADITKDPTLIYVATGTLYMKEGTEAAIPISMGGAIISDFVVSNISPPNASGVVRIEMSIRSDDAEQIGERGAEETIFITQTLK